MWFQVRDSLAQTLNTEIMDTIQKLDKIGKTEASVFQKGGHVAHVTVSDSAHAHEAGHYSSGTSGVYSSVEGSEGSNSPEYNSWRSRVQPHPASTQRWSIQGEQETRMGGNQFGNEPQSSGSCSCVATY